jgi:hypothetical protein
MNVYVESNFCLELAFQQEQAAEAEQLLALAEAGKIDLVFPAFCVCEPYSTLTYYQRQRTILVDEFNRHFRQLDRSPPHQPVVASAKPVIASVLDVGRVQADLLGDVVERMLKCGRSIPLNLALHQRARGYETTLALGPQDAIVASCVLNDLKSLGAPADSHVFVSTNSDDFGPIKGEFETRGCKYLPKFRAAVQWIGSKI